MDGNNNTDPVFKTVGQALFIAFIMEITPLSTPSPTETLIRDLMKQRYGEAPVPQSERSINLGGMTPLELRGQCALIRATVNDHLAGQERDAIYARFGHKYTRALGVRNLRDHYQTLCNSRHAEAILALLWAIYVPGIRQNPGETAQAFNLRRARRSNDWSIRGIEKTYGVDRGVLHRDQQMLRKLCLGVELLAQDKLEELFVRTELICDPAYL